MRNKCLKRTHVDIRFQRTKRFVSLFLIFLDIKEYYNICVHVLVYTNASIVEWSFEETIEPKIVRVNLEKEKQEYDRTT